MGVNYSKRTDQSGVKETLPNENITKIESFISRTSQHNNSIKSLQQFNIVL